MARASKIWVVMQGGYLLGAFTVKREMYEFANRHPSWYASEVAAVVYEVPDGLSLVRDFKLFPLVRPETK